jgi:twitching motility two-component system response regulator PilH
MAKILVADDSKTQLMFIRKVLENTPHQLDFATDGEIAEQKALAGNYDMIILDVVMPKKNGFQLCRDLKKNAKFKNTPILIVTTKNLESDRFWGLKQGADDFIVKPYTEEQLLTSIKKFIR